MSVFLKKKNWKKIFSSIVFGQHSFLIEKVTMKPI